MKMIKVVPTIFYSDIQVGLKLFVDCLGFEVRYSDQLLYVIERDSVTLHLKEDDEFAKKDRPEIRIESDDIEAIFEEIKTKNMEMFHPNLNRIKDQPWGLKEFALLDKSGVCVIIYQRIKVIN